MSEYRRLLSVLMLGAQADLMRAGRWEHCASRIPDLNALELYRRFRIS